MSHPLIDASSVPMEVHAAEVRRARTKLHRDRPTADPAGAPSGLRWRLLEHGGWRLWRGDRCVGAILAGTRPWACAATVYEPMGYWRPVAHGDIDWCARELERAVRRGSSRGTARATGEGAPCVRTCPDV